MSLQFVPRDEVFVKCPVLALHLYEWQQSMFDPSADLYEVGEEVWLDMNDAAPTVLSAEQASELNNENAALCKRMSDEFLEPPDMTKFRDKFLSGAILKDQCIAELEAQSFDMFLKKIGGSVQFLAQTMEWGEIAFIPYIKTPYLVQDNDYPAAQKAEDSLRARGFAPQFSGGVLLVSDEVNGVIEPLFSIARYNASAPYIAFSAPGSSIIGTLCKYGNIHFETYGAGDVERLKAGLKISGFVVPEDGICDEKFTETDMIEGRRIDID